MILATAHFPDESRIVGELDAWDGLTVTLDGVTYPDPVWIDVIECDIPDSVATLTDRRKRRH